MEEIQFIVEEAMGKSRCPSSEPSKLLYLSMWTEDELEKKQWRKTGKSNGK